MDYFLLKQDERYNNVPMVLDVMKKIDKRNINLLKADKIQDTIIFYVKADEETSYLDILHRQLYLVSEKLKKLLEKYDSNIIFKAMPLIDLEHENQENYFLPIFEEVEALSDKCEFNLDKSVIKKLILDEKKIQGKKIFKISHDKQTLVVVRLDIAESILRRDFTGIKLEKLSIE